MSGGAAAARSKRRDKHGWLPDVIALRVRSNARSAAYATTYDELLNGEVLNSTANFGTVRQTAEQYGVVINTFRVRRSDTPERRRMCKCCVRAVAAVAAAVARRSTGNVQKYERTCM